jgi:hypothetical protein
LILGTRAALADIGCILVPLPANATSSLQILDVGVNKPFKDYYKREKESWQVENIVENKVSRELCASWIAKS